MSEETEATFRKARRKSADRRQPLSGGTSLCLGRALNFIDIYSRLQIEDLIQQFQPTMIFVEHDAAFRDKIATEVIEL